MADQIQEMADELLEGMTPREREVTLVASNHQYSCRCWHCLEWFATCQSDDPADYDFGPFTKEEINAKQRELNVPISV